MNLFNFFRNKKEVENNFNTRISNLEDQINTLVSRVSSEPIKSKKFFVTKAILDVFDRENKTLSISEVFDKLEKYNFHCGNPKRNTTYTAIWTLADQGRIKRGEKRGTYKKC